MNNSAHTNNNIAKNAQRKAGCVREIAGTDLSVKVIPEQSIILNCENMSRETDVSVTSKSQRTLTEVPVNEEIQHNISHTSTVICYHQVIEDLIDITPDTSKYVYYCEKCYECFTSLTPGLPQVL